MKVLPRHTVIAIAVLGLSLLDNHVAAESLTSTESTLLTDATEVTETTADLDEGRPTPMLEDMMTTDPTTLLLNATDEPTPSSSVPTTTEKASPVFKDCELRAKACWNFFLVANQTVPDMTTACLTANHSLYCFEEVVANCPLSETSKWFLKQSLWNTRFEMSTFCYRVFIEQVDASSNNVTDSDEESDGDCTQHLFEPLEECAGLHAPKLFEAGSNLDYCCGITQFRECVDNKAPSICSVPLKHLEVANLYRAVYRNIVGASVMDGCLGVTEQHCKGFQGPPTPPLAISNTWQSENLVIGYTNYGYYK